MAIVGVKALRTRLSRYLRRIKRGEEVVVTERGTPVALLQPLRLGQPVEETTALEVKLARLAAQGRLTLPTRKPLRKVRLVRVAGPPISRTILKDRR